MTTARQISRVMSAMGKLAKGHPKRLSEQERERRREAMRAINAKRKTAKTTACTLAAKGGAK